jgi:hypothetical protein
MVKGWRVYSGLQLVNLNKTIMKISDWDWSCYGILTVWSEDNFGCGRAHNTRDVFLKFVVVALHVRSQASIVPLFSLLEWWKHESSYFLLLRLWVSVRKRRMQANPGYDLEILAFFVINTCISFVRPKARYGTKNISLLNSLAGSF